MNITDRFISSLIEKSKSYNDEVVKQAKMCLIDYIACASLGNYLFEDNNNRYLDSFNEKGMCKIIGSDRVSTMLSSALINGINSHALELDDGNRFAMLHLESPIISALLSVYFNEGLTGEQLLKGIIIGYEATVRIASAIQPEHKKRGYHSTGTCGTIGAALGIAAALDYTFEEYKITLSAASTEASSILEVQENSSKLKPYNAGRAAVAAINSAYIARTGYSGPDDVLNGKRGFFHIMAGEVKEEYLTQGFEKYAIELIYRKNYASCRHSHSAIDAALKIRNENSLDYKQINKVVIETYNLAVFGHDHKEIKGVSSAKMSIPYSVAVALKYGNADYPVFNDKYINEQEIKSLINKINIIENKELSSWVPNKRAAIVRIYTKDNEYSCEVDYPKGEPENPISIEELESKFYSLLNASKKENEYSSKILDCIWNIENKYSELREVL